MLYAEALQIALRVVEQLTPYCERCQVAGSIRRKRAKVGDIEVVCIPKKIPAELFGSHEVVVVEFLKTVRDLGTIEKGNPDGGRYVKIMLPEGIALDLFMARPENWGYILAIRTGSASYSHEVLASGWVKHGYRGEDGNLMMGDRIIEVPEERDLFERIHVPYTEPENRHTPKDQVPF